MKTVKFKQFITDNTIEINVLPQPIQEKVTVFERLHEILDNVQDPDYAELLEQLEILDLEILQDMEEYHEDRLQYNDRLALLAKAPTVPKAIRKKAAKRLTTDESIVEELVKMKRTKNIGRTTLKDLGFKCPSKMV